MSRVLITGCSTGIGRATAVELTARGHEVVATARSSDRLADLDVGQRLDLDVDDPQSVAAALTTAGDVDVLVNNAGFGVIGPAETIPLDQVRAMYETNVFGTLRMIQAFVPAMRARGRGHVVNVSSIASRWTVEPLNGLYASTKAAIDAITETMWVELAHFGIRVSLIAPGYTATEWSSNERWLGVDGPYRELYEQVRAGDAEGQSTARPAEVVASTIADAIEADDPTRLRWPGDDTAAGILARRTSYDDTAWERAVAENPCYDW